MRVEAQEGTQVVAVGESLCDIGFPLPLFLDEVYDFMRVWAAYVSRVLIDLGEELGDF